MKKSILAALLLVSMITLAACGGGASSAKPEPAASTPAASTPAPAASTPAAEPAAPKYEAKHFIAGSGYPYNHTWAGYTHDILDLFTELSGGAYTYDLYEGGELVPLLGELDALRADTIQITASFTPFAEKRCHYGDVTLLPALTMDGAVSSKAHLGLMKSDRIIADGKTFYDLEFTDNGVVAFYHPATEPYNLCVSKSVKLDTGADVSGNLRFRSPARMTNIFAENFGITPVTISTYEVYDAMSRGAIEGVILSPDWINVGVTDLIGKVYDVGLGSCTSAVAMTIETWESFPQEFRDAFTAGYEKMMLENANMWAATAEKNWAALEAAGGVRVAYDEMEASMKTAYEKAVVQTWYDYIDSMEAEGYAGKAAALLWRDVAVEAGATFPKEIMELS